MKTLKTLKLTSIIQIIYCIYCLDIFLLLFIGLYTPVNICATIGGLIFFYTTEVTILITPICFIYNLIIFLKELSLSEERKRIGKKWIWIFIWPVVTGAFFLLSAFPFIRAPIFA